MISVLLLVMVLIKVIPNNYVIELYFYFAGLTAATLASLLLVFFKVKSSLHLMGMGSLLMFLISLSIHFEINITMAISMCTLATGLVATSRLYLESHNRAEVLIGFFIGLVSQLMTVRFWL
jgi:hypothetical protein